MASQLHFNDHYKSLLDQLPPSMKKDVWLRLTNRKNKPLSEEQVRDGFEKQLEERELHVQQRENNIKKTIEAQVAEERKHLKDEYDALKSRLESEYNNCMVDMKQKIYSFKHQLEEQQKSGSDDLERQYKSRICALDKSNAVKDKEIGKLSASLSRSKNEIKDLKHVLSSVKKTIKTLDDIIYSKDQTIIAYYDGICSINPDCIDNTIEPTIFYEKEAKVLWTRWHDDAKDDLNI
ncbi:hypothetical protein RhiirA5_424406 [Rhizophagus irregularis]|uniref:Uncharacterized protein n=1 Tax=Rhizophagus irregularis TaxID=588596 RepID=A0A2N0QW30_9GLOM|nr:hypothetical protein RhiirA5_424406 [Rhizophagus irregularis]PKC55255.1 hypothetical protein RhiirA1_475945 [Rhizophagus irregularis]